MEPGSLLRMASYLAISGKRGASVLMSNAINSFLPSNIPFYQPVDHYIGNAAWRKILAASIQDTIVNEKIFDTEAGVAAESVTVTSNKDVPAVVGVPIMLSPDNIRPEGRDPDVKAHV